MSVAHSLMRLLRGTLLALALVALAGCDSAYRFNGVDISGKDYGAALNLTDQFGQQRDMSSFRGKVVAVFFGYTQCPDVCPTNLALFKTLMNKLGTEADQLAVVFVSLDPERDTAEQLKTYMNAFDPRFIALRGSPEATQRVAQAFNVIFSKQETPGSSHYTLDHTASTYLFDAQGRARVLERYGETPERLEADLRQLLIEARSTALVSPGKQP